MVPPVVANVPQIVSQEHTTVFATFRCIEWQLAQPLQVWRYFADAVLVWLRPKYGVAYANGCSRTVNTVKPLWTLPPNQITKEQHRDFYQFISNSWDDPRYTIMMNVDAPISVKSLLYIPTVGGGGGWDDPRCCC